jgi:hypothetical protein
MPRIYATNELQMKGDRLMVRGSGRHSPSVEVVPDRDWPGMWRIRRPDGTVTDMVNRSRARDAATSIALNSQETPLEAPPVRSAA